MMTLKKSQMKLTAWTSQTNLVKDFNIPMVLKDEHKKELVRLQSEVLDKSSKRNRSRTNRP